MVNIYNLFKFLEDKEGTKTPFKVKLIYTPDTLTSEDLKIKGSLNLNDTEITSLPDDLKVGGSLYLQNTPITSLPSDLKVGGNLNLGNVEITSLPDGLKVGGVLYLGNTPLSKKYTKEEIRKIIEDKGGEIKRNIYI